ncbi:Transforming growth factor-beta receptor-associated protein [Actinidia chinensis var. chinensis]|uniref:Transforming growth factor-beta receptor-associated protein n=1 Tax=Actinidia chinensis var. chinensis TaxID=1590841 RepID=A0A2R6QJ51_ACTCC|nr:Transforming growth factor-beta receptor-associated protein [Actinidia chinensis var. chinensis]
MAKLHQNTRSLIEPLADFNLSSSSSSLSFSIKSLAISTLSQSQTLIYAGTHSGSLLLLSLNPNSPPNSNSAHFNLHNHNHNSLPSASISFLRFASVSDLPVEYVHVIDHAGKVLVLSGGFLFLVDLLLLQPVRRLGVFKGVGVVARRVQSGVSENSNLVVGEDAGGGSSSDFSSTGRWFLQKLGGTGGVRSNGLKVKESELLRDSNCVFAVVAGRRLMLVELVLGGRDGDGGSFLVLKEIQCVDGVKTMVWLDDYIIVGNLSGYFSYSCFTGQGGLIFSLPDPSSSPWLKLLLKEYKVLLLVDNVGVIVNAQGQPVGGSLVFRRAPDSVGEIGSSVAVVRNGKLELYHKRSGNCLQIVSFSEEGVGPCVVTDQDGAGQLIFVATPSKVLCYRKVPSEEQIKDLLRKKNFQEAISLVEELQGEGEMTKEMLSFVHAQVGFLLLFDLHFEEAVNHFLLSETMQPSEVFPFIMRDPNRWSLLVFLLNPPNRADLLELAIENIIRYLHVSRDKYLTPSVKEGVDTLLMYLYRALNRVEDMERLATSENCCVVEELETLLNDSGNLRTLAFLYASKGMSSKALAIWRILARNYSPGHWEDRSGEMDSQHFSTNLSSSKKIAAFEASKILEKSSDQDLVLQHLGWIADIDQALAVRILTSERNDQLSPASITDEVIAAIDPKKVEILQSYLQWLIEDQDFEDTQFHTTYALLLAKSAIETFDNLSQNSEAGAVEETSTSVMGRNSIFQSPIRERLQIFLQSSELYDPEEVLDLIEESELWLEKAILYKKLGQETLVLQILALKLEDSEAAEHYCAEIGRPDAYMQLLEMYLDPKDGKEPMFKAAVRLLHNHGESLDPLQVLERLSSDMPLQLASNTILRMLRARLHHHRQGQIVHNLSRAIDIDASLGRMEERSRYVQINDESLCDSCHARLGTKLFAMYPDDTIVCYKCFRRQGESKSITGRDFKQEPMFKAGWLVSR